MTNEYKVVFQGAESEILSDGTTIKKYRLAKAYKHPQLDKRDRIHRTKSEAKILRTAQALGLRCPKVIDVDDYTITMEKIDGSQLTELIRNAEKTNTPIDSRIVSSLAQQLTLLHGLNIAHGDLTPSNFIISGQQAYIIDFGLAQNGKVRDEEKAVDLYVLERSLKCMGAEGLFEQIRREYGDQSVLKRLLEVEKRGRKREKEE